MFTVTKSYRDLPAAHRQPNHDGHCRLIHGHNWGFDLCFSCDTLDANGFVVDVGKLQSIKKLLEGMFDHTLLLNESDPLLAELQAKLKGIAEITVVPNCGMEGLANLIYGIVSNFIEAEMNDGRGLCLVFVTCFEDSKNSATYTPDEIEGF